LFLVFVSFSLVYDFSIIPGGVSAYPSHFRYFPSDQSQTPNHTADKHLKENQLPLSGQHMIVMI
jgi:hypothetical protein